MDAPRVNVIRLTVYTPHPKTEVPLLPIPPKVPNCGVAWGMTAPEVRRPPPVDNLNYPAHLGRDRFESTASAGRRIPSASPIYLPLPIPEDPIPSFAKGGGRG